MKQHCTTNENYERHRDRTKGAAGGTAMMSGFAHLIQRCIALALQYWWRFLVRGLLRHRLPHQRLRGLDDS
jgi:hypothetical protein